MLPTANAAVLQRAWERDLLSGAPTLSPDLSWSKHAAAGGKRLYVARELIFEHAAAWPETWRRWRNRAGVCDAFDLGAKRLAR